MSEELYVAFRTYITEGLLGVGDKEALQIIDSKGYDFERRKEVIKAYRDVTRDEILGPMIPELSSYDLNNEGTDIKTLYGARKREKELTQQTSKPLQAENAVQDPVSESEEPVQTNQEFVDDIKKIQDRIAETQKIMVQEPTLEPSVLIPQQGLDDAKKTNANKKELKLNNVGYANVVLMSIIVIIIMAIIGVFIFVN